MLRNNNFQKRKILTDILTNPSSKFEEEICWQKSDSIGFNDMLFHLNTLKIKIMIIFGIQENGNNLCTHILAKTQLGHEFIIYIDKVQCNKEMIMMTESSAVIVPCKIRVNFTKIACDIPTQFCFLTHKGIDTVTFESKCNNEVAQSYILNNPERDLQNIEDNSKFYIPLPCISYDSLVSDDDTNNIYTYIRYNENTESFSKLLSKSKNKHVLLADGPYTVFVPSNEILKTFEELEKDKLEAYILSHIFPGYFGEDFTGTVKNLNDEEIQIDNGRISLSPGEVFNIKYRINKINGLIALSEGIIIPKKYDQDIININFEKKISQKDIALTSYHLWIRQNILSKNTISDIREQINIITNKLDEYEKIIDEEDKIGIELLNLDDSYRLILLNKDIKTETNDDNLEKIINKIKKLTTSYTEYIKTGVKLSASEHFLSPIVKDVREA